jgi:hypothetical protein
VELQPIAQATHFMPPKKFIPVNATSVPYFKGGPGGEALFNSMSIARPFCSSLHNAPNGLEIYHLN